VTSVPLIRASNLLHFYNHLKKIGSPVDRYLEQARLPLCSVYHPEALIPLYPVMTFVEQGTYRENNPLLGVWVGQNTQVSELGILGTLLYQSLTLYDLLKTLERSLKYFSSGEKFWVRREGDRVWLHNSFGNVSHRGAQQGRVYAVLLYLKLIQLFVEPGWHPLEIHLEIGPIKELLEVKEFAGAQIYFNQPNSAIVFEKALLSNPLRQTRQMNLSSQEYQCWRTSAPALDFVGSLRQTIQLFLQAGNADIEQVAEASGLSVRSLQRRLAEKNLSYSRVVDQVRFDQAIALLNQLDLQIVDIAFELGYADAANFTRAFKRWTGVSPREFRLTQRNIITG